ncbi:SIS domain-containing protein [Nitrosomonas sp.]|uniref:SIS domain-containing protein n=1 Tax=Nitrosomonas sp. TaxID=42353 RepID=UPI001D866215|nr:SIS domain-containing protein [Nitrosomonas sp.]MBX3616261.1 SIS domain-containing protein [Nitrosomonas sp.]
MNENFSITAGSYLDKLQAALSALDRDQIDHAVSLVTSAWENGRQIITLGNGGSSLTALHFINDWNKSIYLSSGKSFRGRSLLDNVGLIMSYSNDISFYDVFVEQLKNIMEPGDLVLALSGSGNSENVIRAVQYANDHGAVTLGLCGYSGGKLKEIAQHHVWAAVNDMQIAEDVHAIFGHIVMQALCCKGRSC